MSGPQSAPAGRYELKYTITPAERQAFLSATRDALRADPHGNNAIYRVSSVYFDTRDFAAYWEKVDGESIRRKYRLRYYGVVSTGQSQSAQRIGPAFMEIKHRIQNTVYKQRVPLTGQGAWQILNDARQLSRLHEHVDWSGRVDRMAVSEIERATARLQLEAKTLITYVREAWQGAVDQRLRLTFDTRGQALPPDAFSLVEGSHGHCFMPPQQVLLEVKFDHAIPRWIRDVLMQQGLSPQRFSKYAAGVEKPARRLMQQMVAHAPQQQDARPPVAFPVMDVPPVCAPTVDH